MNRTVKRILCFILAFMLIASIAVPAFAATPYATQQFNTYNNVRRGYTYNLRFYINAGSYTKYRGYWRARFDTDMYRNSSNKYVGYTNYLYFTGRGYHTVKWTFSSSSYVRGAWYKLRYRTQYRTSIYTSTWRTSTSRWVYFYVY